jgi:sugar phosphate isomerase/epimerase
MQRILSTYRFVHQPLTSSLLAEISRAGISAVEVFCAPSHFIYREPEAVRRLAEALGEYHLELHALHSPTERDLSEGRGSGAPISICDPERIRRMDAVDEVKRALEVAEQIPFHYFIQHLGHARDVADPRKLDAAFNSLEHLVIFAKERGVAIALENTPNELSAPASLRHFISETHLRDLRLCFDIGHAHIEPGVAASFDAMRDLVVTTHIHDNHGDKDEHLLPFEGTIDWDAALSSLAATPKPLPLVIELKEQSPGVPALDQVRAAFDRLEKILEAKHNSATRP